VAWHRENEGVTGNVGNTGNSKERSNNKRNKNENKCKENTNYASTALRYKIIKKQK
jgi:hypothetical protein